ncbi:urea carboxylase [Halotalea alkalilenta]|uniref:Biotin carboxylase n=1 Tax=Halotalea alkalilenta TaxID=376489 RepID=A0A172YJ53_9GAMM|nr:urea carboxylase [Halotalea alkalilenta]ANF59224.1 urea carboxylase [Halotalea alkalilenta]
MFTRVLIANRGEIAVRIIHTLKRLGIESVAVFAEPDRYARHVELADQAVALEGESAAQSYLRGDKIIAAAKASGCEAIIPGYGFLSENAEFATECAAAGIVFIGPTPDQMLRFGLKHTAREIAERAGVPLAPGSGLLADRDQALAEAERLGYPVMLKSTAGGGGIGLTRCADAAELEAAFDSVTRLGQSYFSNAGVFLECFIDHARHVEVQIFGDGRGRVVALGERDCSLQRRNQKVVEETPAPKLPAATRERMCEAAVRLGEEVAYQSAGTVEFIYDQARDAFYFLEVNTRLQVEHPITEMVTGFDLVEWMLRIAAGDASVLDATVAPKGAAIEVRLYAEDPAKNFRPSAGELTEVRWPEPASWLRIDSGIGRGSSVSSHFDPMIAKLITFGADREEALARMRQALDATRIQGIVTNLDYLRAVVRDPDFDRGEVSTRALDTFAFSPFGVEVIAPGTYTTVQDYPGRLGHWDVGVPPSGPMDDRAFRLGNRIVGNHPHAAGLECTLVGPSVRFHAEGVIALTGAPCDAYLESAEGERREAGFWSPVAVQAGDTLVIGKAQAGCRTYLAVRGGFDVPSYLGSRSTFVLGQFGGHAGRTLRAGDWLPIGREGVEGDSPAPIAAPRALDASLLPEYGIEWRIGVLYGPHGAPDYFTAESIERFFATDWEVHYNSNRLGVRLIGPRPTWARDNGGEAGLHPSNVHDCEYAIGAVNFTGDMPVILTHDGPSLGGFVCPVTICEAELWKVGQLKPGDTIRFVPIRHEDALELRRVQEAEIETLSPVAEAARLEHCAVPALEADEDNRSRTLLAHLPELLDRPEIHYRRAGDRYVLIEYGDNLLDLRLRFRLHALMEAIRAGGFVGVTELAPGVRSLQVRFDPLVIAQDELIERLVALEDSLPPIESMRVPSRIVHMPLAFEDSATLGAVERYAETVRAEAPWLPNNVDFIARINGLDSREEVERIVFDASYMVLGLGDVYLGAPCAVPVDPRHRLLSSKYNPARTFTAEGTVGIGGMYMCIYGMDSPGGYQLVGRTLPIWNKHLLNVQFEHGEPWLLKFFDQVRFHPVSESELSHLREEFRHGRHTIEIEPTYFDLADYARLLEQHDAEIKGFQRHQRAAFEREVARWQEADIAPPPAVVERPEVEEQIDGRALHAEITGSVWKVLVEPGQRVAAGEPLIVLEAMKMEIALNAPVAGLVKAVRCRPGQQVAAGEVLVVMDEEERA